MAGVVQHCVVWTGLHDGVCCCPSGFHVQGKFKKLVLCQILLPFEYLVGKVWIRGKRVLGQL